MIDQTALVISALAFIFSLISTAISLRLKKSEMQRSLREQAGAIVQEIIKTNSENNSLWNTPQEKRDSYFYSNLSTMSQRLAAQARQAVHLAEQESAPLTDVECSIIAQALYTCGDLPMAEILWEKAVQASPNEYYSIVNRRGFADFLFRIGVHEKARRLYEEALNVWGSNSDFHKATNGFTYQMRMLSEALNIPNPYNEADLCYRRAKGLFESISNQNMRQHNLNGLEAALQSFSNPLQPNLPTELSNPSGTENLPDGSTGSPPSAPNIQPRTTAPSGTPSKTV